MYQTELFHDGENDNKSTHENWAFSLDYGVAPTPWEVRSKGIYDATGRLLFVPSLVNINRGFVSSNYENMDAVVRGVNQLIDNPTPATPNENASLQMLQSDIVALANNIFPHRTPQQGFLKLFEEIGEVLQDPYNHSEWADVFIMLLDIADHYKIDGNALFKAIHNKMEVNSKRKWVSNSMGVMRHSDEPTDELKVPVVLSGGAFDGVEMYVSVKSYDDHVESFPPEVFKSTESGVIFVYSLTSNIENERVVYTLDRVME